MATSKKNLKEKCFCAVFCFKKLKNFFLKVLKEPCASRHITPNQVMTQLHEFVTSQSYAVYLLSLSNYIK